MLGFKYKYSNRENSKGLQMLMNGIDVTLNNIINKFLNYFFII